MIPIEMNINLTIGQIHPKFFYDYPTQYKKLLFLFVFSLPSAQNFFSQSKSAKKMIIAITNT